MQTSHCKELRMLSTVPLNRQVTMIPQIQVLNCKNCNQCLKCHKSPKLSLQLSFWVRSCLLITLIKCLKGHKSLGSLGSVVKVFIVSWVQPTNGQTDKVTYWAVCGQLKIYHMLGLSDHLTQTVFVYLCICICIFGCQTLGNIVFVKKLFEVLVPFSFQKYITSWVFSGFYCSRALRC